MHLQTFISLKYTLVAWIKHPFLQWNIIGMLQDKIKSLPHIPFKPLTHVWDSFYYNCYVVPIVMYFDMLPLNQGSNRGSCQGHCAPCPPLLLHHCSQHKVLSMNWISSTSHFMDSILSSDKLINFISINGILFKHLRTFLQNHWFLVMLYEMITNMTHASCYHLCMLTWNIYLLLESIKVA